MQLKLKKTTFKLFDFILRKTYSFLSISNNELSNQLATNILAIFMSMFISGFFLALSGILAARILGPSEYGRYSLIVSIGNLVIIPMIFGMSTSIVRYLSPGKTISKIIGTSIILFLLFSSISFSIGLIFTKKFALFFGIDSYNFHLALFFGLVLAIFSVSKAYMQGLHRLKKYAVFESLVGFVSFAVLLFFLFFLRNKTYISPTFAILIGWVLAIALILVNIRKLINFRFDFQIAKKIIHYSFFSLAGGVIGFFLYYFDRIFVNKMLGPEQTGIYVAYLSSINCIISPLVQVFVASVFPALSKTTNKSAAFESFRKIEYKIYPIVFCVSCVGVALLVKLIGKSYPFNWGFVLLFSFYGLVFFGSTIRSWFINAIGVKGAKFVTIQGMIASIIIVLLNYFLTKKIGIVGAAISAIIAFICIFIINNNFFRRYNANPKKFDD